MTGFVHDGALPHPLTPRHYVSPELYEEEWRRIFRPAWHMAAVTSEIGSPGQYVARDVGRTPVIIRNCDGDVRAFLNVCAHRHCALVSDGCGASERIQCQYHGWEYGPDGALAHLPDGRSFKGMKAAGFRLQRVRAECIGPLVFVCVDDGTPALRAWLGEEVSAELERWFTGRVVGWTKVSEHDVNWKIICENAVESYHVPRVHPETFRNFRPPEAHEHRLGRNFTSYLDLLPWGLRPSEIAVRAVTRILLRDATKQRFKHSHIFPNLLTYTGDLLSDLAVVEPLGPTRSRHTQYAFVPGELRFPVVTRHLRTAYAETLRRGTTRIFQEDARAWGAMQRGMEHSPFTGILSAREERVHAFQDWVARALA